MIKRICPKTRAEQNLIYLDIVQNLLENNATVLQPYNHETLKGLLHGMTLLSTSFFNKPIELKKNFGKRGALQTFGYEGVDSITNRREGKDEKELYHITRQKINDFRDFITNEEQNMCDFEIFMDFAERLVNYIYFDLQLECEIGLNNMPGFGKFPQDANTRPFRKSILRGLKYPAKYGKHQDIIASAHTDIGFLTLVPYCPGIEIYNFEKGRWESWVEDGKDQKFLIIPGQMLEFMTDGKIKALPHRVRKVLEHDRIQFVYFAQPPLYSKKFLEAFNMTTKQFFNRRV